MNGFCLRKFYPYILDTRKSVFYCGKLDNMVRYRVLSIHTINLQHLRILIMITISKLNETKDNNISITLKCVDVEGYTSLRDDHHFILENSKLSIETIWGTCVWTSENFMIHESEFKYFELNSL